MTKDCHRFWFFNGFEAAAMPLLFFFRHTIKKKRVQENLHPFPIGKCFGFPSSL